MRGWIVFAVTLWGLLSWAAPPRVAVHPLVVVGGDAKAVEQTRADFLTEAARQPIEMASMRQVADVVSAEPGSTCDGHPGCLERLCRETKTSYALLARFRFDGPNFVVSVQLVSANGTVVRTVERSVEKDLFAPRTPQVQDLFLKIFTELKLGSLTLPTDPVKVEVAAVSVARPPPVNVAPPPVSVAQPPPVSVAQPPPVSVARPPPVSVAQPPPARSAETSGLRIAGAIVGGVAVATAAVGGGLAISAQVMWGDLRKELMEGNLPDTMASQERAKALDQRVDLTYGVFAAAGVVAATSALMLLLSSDSKGSSVSLAPVDGGAIVGLSGTF